MRRRWPCFVVAPLVVAACDGDHSNLAAHGGAGGAGGTVVDGGSGGAGGSAATDAGGDAPADSPGDATDAATDGDAAPSGPDRFVVVHGVVDEPTVAVCFGSRPAGELVPFGLPLWIEWGHVAMPTLTALDLASTEVQPIVIVGDLQRIAGRDCAGALALAESLGAPRLTDVLDGGTDADTDAGSGAPGLDASDAPSDAPSSDASDAALTDAALDVSDASDAGDPPLRTFALPLLPAGTLTSGRSVALVLTGCTGGSAHSGGAETIACGQSYTPSRPTLAPLVVAIPRATRPGLVGLTVLNASRASDTLDFGSRAAEDGGATPVVLATGAARGAVTPKVPTFASSALGYSASSSEITVSPQGGTVPWLVRPWNVSLVLGGVGALRDEHAYLLVYVGPRPDLAASSWWRQGELVLLDANQ